MSAKTLLAIAVASIMLVGTAAAVGAAAPADQAHENATADRDHTPVDEDDLSANETTIEPPGDESDVEKPGPADTPGHGNGDGPADGAPIDGHGPADTPASDGVGPADGLPSVVPDHVPAIHDTIDSFLDGSVENLGNALSDLVGGDGESDPVENSTAADRP